MEAVRAALSHQTDNMAPDADWYPGPGAAMSAGVGFAPKSMLARCIELC